MDNYFEKESVVVSKKTQYTVLEGNKAKSACSLICLEAVYQFLFEESKMTRKEDIDKWAFMQHIFRIKLR